MDRSDEPDVWYVIDSDGDPGNDFRSPAEAEAEAVTLSRRCSGSVCQLWAHTYRGDTLIGLVLDGVIYRASS